MGRRCKTCEHPERAVIERGVLTGKSFRGMGKNYDLSQASIRRHFEGGHIADTLLRAIKSESNECADELFGKLAFLSNRALALMVKGRGARGVWVRDMAFTRAIRLISIQTRIVEQIYEKLQIKTNNTDVLVVALQATDRYVCDYIRQGTSLERGDIPQSLVEAYRAYLKTKRVMREGRTKWEKNSH